MVRAKKSEDLIKANVSARIDKALKAHIEELAKAKKWTVSQYIEIALTQHVDELPQAAATKRAAKKKPS